MSVRSDEMIVLACAKLFDEIVERSRRPFPVEPIRTLDAIHLASALVLRVAFPDLVVLSLDRRLRASAQELGFEILPPGP